MPEEIIGAVLEAAGEAVVEAAKAVGEVAGETVVEAVKVVGEVAAETVQVIAEFAVHPATPFFDGTQTSTVNRREIEKKRDEQQKEY